MHAIPAALALLLFVFSSCAAAQFRIGSTVPVGAGAQRVALSPDESEVWVLNAAEGTVSVVDAIAGKEIVKREVGGTPRAIAFNPAGTRAYIAVYGDGNLRGGGVAIFDAAKKTPLRRLSIPMGGGRDCPGSDIAFTPQGKAYVAMIYCGLFKLDAGRDVLDSVDRTRCAMNIAIAPDGAKAYVNYQCAPQPGSNGHDPIFVFDTATDKPLSTITHLDGTRGERIANVGGYMTMSPLGTQLWVMGNDACSLASHRGSNVYDLEGCPALSPREKRVLRETGSLGRGIINIIDLDTNDVEPKAFRPRDAVSGKPLGAGTPTFFPDGSKVAISTGSRLLVFDAGTLDLTDGGLDIPGAGNVAFTKSGTRAYVPSYERNMLYVLDAPLTLGGALGDLKQKTLKKLREEPWAFGGALLAGIQALLVVLAFASMRFARAFSGVRYLILPLEVDIYVRRGRSRLVRYYLRQLRRRILERRGLTASKTYVSLPVSRNGQWAQSEDWMKDALAAVAGGKRYVAAIKGSGGTGKTHMMEELVLQLTEGDCVPVMLQAVDYNSEPTFAEWIGRSFERAQLPISARLLQAVPRAVLIVDQVSEVRQQCQDSFWKLVTNAEDPVMEGMSLILSGRPVDAFNDAAQRLPGLNEVVDCDQDLQDVDIKRLGEAHIDPGGGSDEIEALPAAIRALAGKPTAFIVTQFAKARVASSRPIARREDLYQEILDRHIKREVTRLRPDVVKLVLEKLVARHYGATGNRGIPLARATLEKEVADIFDAEALAKRFGASNVPSSAEFVEQLLVSGLVYATQTAYFFFHDSFEDWLRDEAAPPGPGVSSPLATQA